MERPVRQVRIPILEVDELPCEGRQPDQAVMGGVVVGTHQSSQHRLVSRQGVVFLPVPGTASFLLDIYGLPQAELHQVLEVGEVTLPPTAWWSLKG